MIIIFFNLKNTQKAFFRVIEAGKLIDFFLKKKWVCKPYPQSHYLILQTTPVELPASQASVASDLVALSVVDAELEIPA